MKSAQLLVALALVGISCKENRAEGETANQDPKSGDHASGYWEKLTMQPIYDAEGMVMVALPFPSTWKVMQSPRQGEPSIIGPHGTKVFDFPGRSFLYNNDPAMQRTYQQSGQLMRVMPGIDALVREDLVPWSANLGLRYLRHFEAAKKQLIFSLANGRYNPQQIMAYNQREAQKAGQGLAAHNQRMAANQAAFEASQRAHVNRSNAINDAIMSGWRERNAVSDKAHERFIDTINEKTNVVDPTSGQAYKVDSGSNNYWMNRDGKYISTDHSTYDPNLDDYMNQQHWQKLENAG